MEDSPKHNCPITQPDEIAAMRYLVQILYDHHLITEAEKKKILTEYH